MHLVVEAKKVNGYHQCRGKWCQWSTIQVVYHLPQIPGNSGWDVNGNAFLVRSTGKKVVPFSRLGRSEWRFVTTYKFLEFRTSFML